MIDTINPYVATILITAKDGDSVRAISKRIGLSYAWTYKWVEKLVDVGMIKRSKQKIRINKENSAYREFISFIRKMLKIKLSISDAYSLPNLSGLPYAFTSIDAVFIWTKGGYNIGRNTKCYPIFIEVLEDDIGRWEQFFDRFSIRHTKSMEGKKGAYFILKGKEEINKEYTNGVSVIPLKTTVEYARKYIYNFEPALEMLDEMYHLGIGAQYAEKGAWHVK